MKASLLTPRRLSKLLLAGTALALVTPLTAERASAGEGALVVAQAAPAPGEDAQPQRRRERQGGDGAQGAGAPARGNAEGAQGGGAAAPRRDATGAESPAGPRRDRAGGAEEPAQRRGAGGAEEPAQGRGAGGQPRGATPAEPATSTRPSAEPATPARPAGAAPTERPADRTPSRAAPETSPAGTPPASRAAPGRNEPASAPPAARTPTPESPTAAPADTGPRGRQERPAAGTERPDRPDRQRANETAPGVPADAASPQTRPGQADTAPRTRTPGDPRTPGDQTAPGAAPPAAGTQPGRQGGADRDRQGGVDRDRQGGAEPGRQGAGERDRQGGQGAFEPGRQGGADRDRERDRARDDRFAPGLATGERRDVRVEELRGLRRERVEEGGRRVIIEEPGNRIIVREGNRVVIRHDETERFRQTYRNAQVRTERRGVEEVTIVRQANGVEIVTVRDQQGNLIRRVRREPAGREVVLIENVVRGRPGSRTTVIEEVVNLPPPRVQIPREKYIVEVEQASQQDLVEAFTAPPVERIERRYTLDEVRQSQTLRERVRRVDLDTVTFGSGSWTLSEDQIGAMTGIAQAIERALQQNPNEIFLIEGHTDAVGDDVDNLTLSDRRAETVAIVLSERFNIPAENLTTQGYGEQYLKVDTQEPDRENRRVTLRRITPLLNQEAAR